LPERPLHIAYVTTGYPYVSHTFIQNEVAALRAMGVRIDTFAISRSPASECRTPADREARATTYALRPPNPWYYARAHLRWLLRRPTAYLRALGRALRLGAGSPEDLAHQLAYFVQAVVLWDRCRAAGITHVHAHFANVASDVASLAAALGDGEMTWSFSMHGPAEFYDVRHHHLAEKTRNARFVICVSDFARSQLMALTGPDHWDKLHVVRCGVDVSRFAPVARTSGDGPLCVTCVGRLVPEKGQQLLIEAAAAIRRTGVDLRVVLAGNGPRRAFLEACAAKLGLGEHVEFLGAVAHTEVDDLLRRSDIFCLPSFAEGVPIVLMEAMATALPVVACRVMGIPELIEDGVDGRLLAPGSVTDLIDAVSALASAPDERRRLGQAARAKVAAQFELSANARRLRRIYEDLLNDVAPAGDDGGTGGWQPSSEATGRPLSPA
jgi:colanic acid/amylovoran biosynthesis glycosyltransferase